MGPSRAFKQPPATKQHLASSDDADHSEEEPDTKAAITFFLNEAKELEPDQRDLFLRRGQPTNFEAYIQQLKDAIQETVWSSKAFKISKKMKPIYQLASSVAPIVNSASQVSPMPASLVLGGITSILSMSTRIDDFQTRLIDMLEWMGDEVDLINKYREDKILDDDSAVTECEINLAADILRFCIETAKLFYDDHAKSKNGAKFALRTQFKDFEARFGDATNDFKLHLSALEKRRTLFDARKLKSVHEGVNDISKLLEHGYGQKRGGATENVDGFLRQGMNHEHLKLKTTSILTQCRWKAPHLIGLDSILGFWRYSRK